MNKAPAFGLAVVMAAAFTGCGSYTDGAYGGARSYPSGNPGRAAPWNAGAGGSGGAGGAAPMPANAGDRYTPPGTNPFVLTERDPFSTFAVDVDTASYDIFRRDVNMNALPQPASVRLEEYVNAFSYDYPGPAENEEAPFRISVAASGQVFDRPSVLLRVGIQGKRPPPFQKRPANLVFLVDVSGSMDAPDKLPLVRTLLMDALEVLEPTDKVSIVTYAGDTRVRLAPTAVGSGRQAITGVISQLQAGGSTAGASGLQLAYEQAGQAFIPEGINHILLCTDGDFNVGPSTTKELVEIVRDKRKGGVTLTVLGFGVGNLNDSLMEAVANNGNGIYGVISDEAYARRYVQQKMLSTLDHIAKDMKIQVEFNPQTVHAYRLLGYENRAIADRDFRNDGIDAGEIGAGHRVTALYEVIPSGQSIPARAGAPMVEQGTPSDLPRQIAPGDLVMVKVRWKGVAATETTPAFEMSSSLAGADIAEGLGRADSDLQWAAAVASFAEILKNSPYADRTQLPTIRQIVEAQSQRDEERSEFARLLGHAVPLLPAAP